MSGIDIDGLDRFASDTEALAEGLEGAAAMTASFDAELRRMRDSLGAAGREASALSSGITRGVARAFDGLVMDGMRLSDAFRTVGQSIVDTIYAIAMKPVETALGGAIAGGISAVMGGLMPFAQGGAFSQGHVLPFARGGVVTAPTTFPLRGGRGLMGEAGPEAILPLARGADGRLGVRAAGGGTSVVVNITTPDVAGFRRSEGQIAAALARAVARGEAMG
ncbi:MAG: phage tail tape measure protein [Rhodobacteraceae bacterium]|nr:phage tail tape measure protein [Paracoccaceae bacterium]